MLFVVNLNGRYAVNSAEISANISREQESQIKLASHRFQTPDLSGSHSHSLTPLDGLKVVIQITITQSILGVRQRNV